MGGPPLLRALGDRSSEHSLVATGGDDHAIRVWRLRRKPPPPRDAAAGLEHADAPAAAVLEVSCEAVLLGHEGAPPY